MKIKEIKIREDDGSYSDAIPVGADAINVDMANGNNMEDEIIKILNSITKLNDTYYYKDIEIITGYYETSKTHYYIAHIPYKDSNGNIIQIKHGYANDNFESTRPTETAREFSQRKNASLVCNASPFFVDGKEHNNFIVGLVIHNGEIIADTRDTLSTINQYYILGIKDNNEIKVYDPQTSSSVILNDGVKETITGFIPIMKNGESCKDSLLATSNWNTRYNRTILGQNTLTKDFYIFACNGKGTIEEQGMTNDEVIEILKPLDIDFAYQLDGGGSSQMVYRNNLLNMKTDKENFEERKVCDFIYFSKDEPLNNDAKSEQYMDIIEGNIKEEVNIRPDITGLVRLKSTQGTYPLGIEVYQNGDRNTRVGKLGLKNTGITYWIDELQNFLLYVPSEEERDNIKGLFQILDKVFGYFPASATTISNTSSEDIDTLTYSNIVFLYTDYTKNPFKDNKYKCFLIHLSAEAEQKHDTAIQIAVPYGVNGSKLGVKIRRKASNTWSDWENLIPSKTDWKQITNDKGTLNYRIIGDILYLSGSFSNITEQTVWQIPNCTPKYHSVFLLPGGEYTYTKGWVTEHGAFTITPGVDTTKTYWVNQAIPL